MRELLLDPDDRQVILAAGDEIALTSTPRRCRRRAPGWRRTVFLESHGWDKDADRNTWEATQMEPLPFRAMKSYPYAAGETYPDTPELRRYREEWLTREVAAPSDELTVSRRGAEGPPHRQTERDQFSARSAPATAGRSGSSRSNPSWSASRATPTGSLSSSLV